MTISLFPCGATPCGCPQCESFLDLTRETPDARVVIYHPGATMSGELQSGSVTYEPSGGGTPTTVSMTLVYASHKLCLGPSQSFDGQLLYTFAVPLTAIITMVSYTFLPSGGGDPVSITRNAVTTCENGATDIIRQGGDLDCNLSPSVVVLADSCSGCTNPTGTSTLCGSATSSLTDTNPGGAGRGSWACNPGHVINGGSATPWAGLTPCTPSGSARPCNWTDLTFSFTDSGTYVATNPFGCGGSITVVLSTTIAKTAGQNTVTLSGSVSWSGASVSPQDVAPWSTAYPWNGADNVITDTSHPIPCAGGYQVRLRTGFAVSQQASGSWYNGIYISGALTMSYNLEPTP